MCSGVIQYIAETVKLVGKMPTTCAVYGCKKRQSSCISQSFYRIPQDTDRERKWLAFIGRKSPDGMPWKPGSGHIVCSDHFISGKI